MLSRSVEHYRINLNNGLTRCSNNLTQRQNIEQQCSYHFIMRKPHGKEDWVHPEVKLYGKLSLSSTMLVLYLTGWFSLNYFGSKVSIFLN